MEIFAADMFSQAEVRRLAAQVLCTYPRLDVLVRNAGGFWASRHVYADGLEHTFVLNHLAPLSRTGLLLDRLTAPHPPGSSPSPPGGRRNDVGGRSLVPGRVPGTPAGLTPR